MSKEVVEKNLLLPPNTVFICLLDVACAHIIIVNLMTPSGDEESVSSSIIFIITNLTTDVVHFMR